GSPIVTDPAVAFEVLAGNIVKLSWTKATDSVTDQANIKYNIKYTTSEPITDFTQCNAATHVDMKPDIDEYKVERLPCGQDIYVNIAAVDDHSSENKRTLYQPLTIPALSA